MNKKNTIFQNRGRPQGNTNKVGNHEFQKKKNARKATQTKWKIANLQNRRRQQGNILKVENRELSQKQQYNFE